MQHVQSSEMRLEEKQEHCTASKHHWKRPWALMVSDTDANVVKAFENALALL
jgi:hypothetical protein